MRLTSLVSPLNTSDSRISTSSGSFVRRFGCTVQRSGDRSIRSLRRVTVAAFVAPGDRDSIFRVSAFDVRAGVRFTLSFTRRARLVMPPSGRARRLAMTVSTTCCACAATRPLGRLSRSRMGGVEAGVRRPVAEDHGLGASRLNPLGLGWLSPYEHHDARDVDKHLHLDAGQTRSGLVVDSVRFGDQLPGLHVGFKGACNCVISVCCDA
jgi:hypothetical protein